MYPQVTQFETRKRLVANELQVLRQRHSRRPSRSRVHVRVGVAFNGTAATLRRVLAGMRA